MAAERAAARAELREEPKPNEWEELNALIIEYGEACIAESWKGGGDPLDIPVVEAHLELVRSKLRAHMERMQRELT